MKSLGLGESIRGIFEVDCKYGRSFLYLTNFGIMLESSKIVLDLDFYEITGLRTINKRLAKLAWREDQQIFSLILNSNVISKVVYNFNISQKDFFQKINMIKSLFLENNTGKGMYTSIQNTTLGNFTSQHDNDGWCEYLNRVL